MPGSANCLNIVGNGVPIFDGVHTFSAATIQNHGVVIGNPLNGITSITPDASTTKVLVSGGASADPSWQAVSAAGGISTITGDSGGAESPSSGNFNILGSGSITTVGTANTETVTLTGLTNHAILVGAGTTTITKVGPTATAGQILQSAGSSADPVFSTATYPATTTINQILYSSSANVVGGITGSNDGVLITSHTGVPSLLAAGTTGQVLTATTGAPASWASPATSGTVTSVSVVSANGLAGTVATATSTPAITLSTTITGVLSGNGTAITGSSVTQHGVVVAGASNALSSIAPGTSGNVLTSNGTDWASSAAAGGGITTINGNSGSITGSTVSIVASQGTSVFTNSSTTSTLTFMNGSNSIAIGGASSVGTGSQCTVIGLNAGGGGSMSGFGNTGVGTTALFSLTNGAYNCGFGPNAASGIQGGSANIGIGYNACAVVSGSSNICIGYHAGVSYNGAESSNICLGTESGVNGESNTLHLGNGTGTASGNLNAAFICGIQGITVSGTPVLISSGDQLGIAVSSKRFKENIVDMCDCSKELFSLRPVNFTINRKSAPGLEDATKDIQYGLIAEEVHDVMPYLCYYDKEGAPLGVKYDQLPVMLLAELQKALKRIAVLEAKLGV